ncbi:hypothetical protein [Caulobacter sp. 17J80-11]|uniref:AAA family ATPase n=1 Tax=Caulobacter sp. 17J80-11 TaxID=2763502 RepID=UPI001653B6A7|nr:hypothetical protein [Caulobacter sp. 17J80-11]MBC6982418.1 hypothetical protein [Caulobacter sp. 17J80-11]
MSDRRKVLALAAGEDLVGALREARLGVSGVDVEVGPMRPAQALADSAPGVLVLEVDAARTGAIEHFQAFVRALPECRIVAAARAANSETVRRLFRAGATDVVTAPFSADAFAASLADLFKGETSAGGGSLIAVVKAGGGVGATLVAVNLAVLLQGGGHSKGAASKSAALLDFDLQFGDAAAALDLQPRSTLVDILRARDRFDGRFLDGVLTPHASGLKVLAAPPTIVPSGVLDGGFAETVLHHATASHDVTVVDLPTVWSDWTLPVLRRADAVVLVARPTVSGALRARRVLDACEEARLDTPVVFVLNGCAGPLEAIERSDRIGKSLGRPVDAALSLDAAAGRAADRGRPVVDAFPNTRLSRELRTVARKVELKLGEAGPRDEAFAAESSDVRTLAGAPA